jgi:hypothetical protein
MREWVLSNVYCAYQQFINQRFGVNPPADLEDPYSGVSVEYRYAWQQLKKFDHVFKSVKEGDTKQSFLRASYMLDGDGFSSLPWSAFAPGFPSFPG